MRSIMLFAACEMLLGWIAVMCMVYCCYSFLPDFLLVQQFLYEFAYTHVALATFSWCLTFMLGVGVIPTIMCMLSKNVFERKNEQ